MKLVFREIEADNCSLSGPRAFHHPCEVPVRSYGWFARNRNLKFLHSRNRWKFADLLYLYHMSYERFYCLILSPFRCVWPILVCKVRGLSCREIEKQCKTKILFFQILWNNNITTYYAFTPVTFRRGKPRSKGLGKVRSRSNCTPLRR